MSFLEDLFEGRKHGYRGGHGHHDDHDDRYRAPEPLPRYGPPPSAPQTACGQCRTLVAMMPGFRFCPYCGGSLATTPVCAACGAARTPGAAFCQGCGTRF